MCPPNAWAGGRLRLLADQLDYIVGVDPHRDVHAVAVVHVLSGAVVFEANVASSSDGYAHALALVEAHSRGRRALAIEGTGSFGAGLTRFLTGKGERVLEAGRLRRERRSGGKTDPLDAVRALPQALPRTQPLTATREPANQNLTNIEASLAQSTAPSGRGRPPVAIGSR